MLWQYNQNHNLDTWWGTDQQYNYHNLIQLYMSRLDTSLFLNQCRIYHCAYVCLKAHGPVGRGGGGGGHLPAKKKIYNEFLLM